jgi:hypothetical protein
VFQTILEETKIFHCRARGGCTYWTFRLRKENVTKVRFCDYFLETTRVVQNFQTEDVKSMCCVSFAKYCFILWFIWTTLSESLVTCIVSMVGRMLNDELGKIWNRVVTAWFTYYPSICVEALRRVRTAVAPPSFELDTCRIQRAALSLLRQLVAKYCSDVRLLPRCNWCLRSSEMLRSVGWSVATDVSWQRIGPILKSPAVRERRLIHKLGDSYRTENPSDYSFVNDHFFPITYPRISFLSLYLQLVHLQPPYSVDSPSWKVSVYVCLSFPSHVLAIQSK